MPTDKKNQPRATDSATAADKRIRPERRTAVDRRTDVERRTVDKAVAVERRVKDRRVNGEPGERRKVERRINEYPMSPEVLEFINAVNEFKTVQQKPFPSWSDIFGIFESLGYRCD